MAWRRAKTKHLKATQLDKVRQQLEKLRKEIAIEEADLPFHVIALRISHIIRSYLGKAFEDPVLFETDEEFTLRESALAQLHPDSQQPVADYLHTLSQIKYAPINTPTDANELINNADTLLANLEINVQPEGEKNPKP